MHLKIAINIPDDRPYRQTFSPYDISHTELAVDIEQAVSNVLSAMQSIDMREATAALSSNGRKLGTVSITLE